MEQPVNDVIVPPADPRFPPKRGSITRVWPGRTS
jgi:hypothetical protein